KERLPSARRLNQGGQEHPVAVEVARARAHLKGCDADGLRRVAEEEVEVQLLARLERQVWRSRPCRVRLRRRVGGRRGRRCDGGQREAGLSRRAGRRGGAGRGGLRRVLYLRAREFDSNL